MLLRNASTADSRRRVSSYTRWPSAVSAKPARPRRHSAAQQNDGRPTGERGVVQVGYRRQAILQTDQYAIDRYAAIHGIPNAKVVPARTVHQGIEGVDSGNIGARWA